MKKYQSLLFLLVWSAMSNMAWTQVAEQVYPGNGLTGPSHILITSDLPSGEKYCVGKVVTYSIQWGASTPANTPFEIYDVNGGRIISSSPSNVQVIWDLPYGELILNPKWTQYTGLCGQILVDDTTNDDFADPVILQWLNNCMVSFKFIAPVSGELFEIAGPRESCANQLLQYTMWKNGQSYSNPTSLKTWSVDQDASIIVNGTNFGQIYMGTASQVSILKGSSGLPTKLSVNGVLDACGNHQLPLVIIQPKNNSTSINTSISGLLCPYDLFTVSLQQSNPISDINWITSQGLIISSGQGTQQVELMVHPFAPPSSQIITASFSDQCGSTASSSVEIDVNQCWIQSQIEYDSLISSRENNSCKDATLYSLSGKIISHSVSCDHALFVNVPSGLYVLHYRENGVFKRKKIRIN